MPKTTLTVHATGSPPSKDITRRDIDLRDRRNGLAEIGYHYLIRRDGTVESGRHTDSASVHDELNLAKKSVSVCLVGGTDEIGEPTNNYTEAQNQSLKRLHEQVYPGLGVFYVHPSLRM